MATGSSPMRRLAAALLALAALGAPARAADIDWGRAETSTVVMTEYRFVPDHLRLRAGVPYRLQLENQGKELHELTAPEFFRSVLVRNREVLVPASQDVVLQPGAKKDVYFLAEEPGRYKMTCADHDFLDMAGEIIVE
jgi:plastocyanin